MYQLLGDMSVCHVPQKAGTNRQFCISFHNENNVILQIHYSVFKISVYKVRIHRMILRIMLCAQKLR